MCVNTNGDGCHDLDRWHEAVVGAMLLYLWPAGASEDAIGTIAEPKLFIRPGYATELAFGVCPTADRVSVKQMTSRSNRSDFELTWEH